MKLAGEYVFDAPQDVVWDALQDPEVLAAVMPGCEKLEMIGEDEYEGILKIKVGPVQGKFKGNVKLEDINEPDSYSMSVDGKGAPGFMRGGGGVKLTAQGDTTLMEYKGEAQVGGKIASVGQRLLDSSAKAIVKQSLEGLNTLIQAKMVAANAPDAGEDAEAQPLPKIEIKAPSDLEFAAGVAKDVVDDLIPREYRPVLILVGVALAIAFLFAVLRRK